MPDGLNLGGSVLGAVLHPRRHIALCLHARGGGGRFPAGGPQEHLRLAQADRRPSPLRADGLKRLP